MLNNSSEALNNPLFDEESIMAEIEKSHSHNFNFDLEEQL